MAELQENTATQDRSTISMTLSPFLELLKEQKQHMTQTNWLRSVRTLMFRIIETPEQYLTKDLAQAETTTGIIRSVFHEFILTHTPFQFPKKNS